VTEDQPRREPDTGSPRHDPQPDPRILPDGSLIEPPLPEQGLTSEPVEPVGAGREATAWPDDPDGTEEPERRRVVVKPRGRYLGIVAFILAALLFAANIVGIVLSNTGSEDAALSIAYVTIFSTIFTFLGGLIAAVFNFGRVWGVGAVILSVLANPFVLVVLLGSFSGAVF
jgi:hypothetical protein